VVAAWIALVIPPHSHQCFQPCGGAPLADDPGVFDPAAVDVNVLHRGGDPGMYISWMEIRSTPDK